MNYLELSQYDLEREFFSACRNNLPLVKYFLTSPDLNVKAHAVESMGLRMAASSGNIEIVRYLLTSRDISEHAKIHDSNNATLNAACLSGQLHIVKYLLTSNELHENAWVHGYVSDLLINHPISVKHLDTPFIDACSGGHVDVMDYLLTSNELPEHCSIYAQNNMGFQKACKQGHLEAVQYLLDFPGFSESDNYTYSLYEGVITSFHNSQRHITDFLLNNIFVPINHEGKYNIEGVFNVLKDFPDEAKELVELIEVRNRYLELHNKFPDKKTFKNNKI